MMDNYDRWEAHDNAKEAELLKLPQCVYCDERIQDDFYFDINDEVVCEGCLKNHFRKRCEEFVS